jgi:hypothetical protein
MCVKRSTLWYVVFRFSDAASRLQTLIAAGAGAWAPSATSSAGGSHVTVWWPQPLTPHDGDPTTPGSLPKQVPTVKRSHMPARDPAAHTSVVQPAKPHKHVVAINLPCDSSCTALQLSARPERLRHPCGVAGLQWSPGGALGHASPQVRVSGFSILGARVIGLGSAAAGAVGNQHTAAPQTLVALQRTTPDRAQHVKGVHSAQLHATCPSALVYTGMQVRRRLPCGYGAPPRSCPRCRWSGCGAARGRRRRAAARTPRC